MKRPVALVIDRDPAVRERIRSTLEQLGVDTLSAASAAESTDSLRNRSLCAIVADVETPGLDVSTLAARAQSIEPLPIVIAMTEQGDGVEPWLDAGAFDVLRKPLDDARLRWTLRAALHHHVVVRELHALRSDLQRREGYDGIVGRSSQIERLREHVSRLARDDAPVWFCGEAGSGKEHAARELHACSDRSGRRFEVLTSAGPDGRSWGARLGVDRSGNLQQDGFLTALRGGTLYLENLPAQPPDEQSRLLPVLDAVHDVRILAGSTGDPARLAEEGRLLEDLRRRLAVETVSIAPLRERLEDIPLLARHFIRTICRINELPPIQLEAEALTLLERYRWPDNVQGLRNALEQAAIVSPDGKIRPRDLPDEVRDVAGAAPGATSAASGSSRTFRDAKREVVDHFERRYLRDLMERHGGNVTAASEQAGMLRSALQRLLRKYGLKSADFRRARVAGQQGGGARPRG